MDSIGLKELLGKECKVYFDMELEKWPVSGYPALCVVLDVDMGVIKLKGLWSSKPFWINISKIETISIYE